MQLSYFSHPRFFLFSFFFIIRDFLHSMVISFTKRFIKLLLVSLSILCFSLISQSALCLGVDDGQGNTVEYPPNDQGNEPANSADGENNELLDVVIPNQKHEVNDLVERLSSIDLETFLQLPDKEKNEKIDEIIKNNTLFKNNFSDGLEEIFKQEGFTRANWELWPVKLVLCVTAAFACGINTWAVAGNGVNILAAFFTAPRSAMAAMGLTDKAHRLFSKKLSEIAACCRNPYTIFKLVTATVYGFVYTANDANVAGLGFRDLIGHWVGYPIGVGFNGFFTMVLGSIFAYDFLSNYPPTFLAFNKDNDDIQFHRHDNKIRAIIFGKIMEKFEEMRENGDTDFTENDVHELFKQVINDSSQEVKEYCQKHDINSTAFIAEVLQNVQGERSDSTKKKATFKNTAKLIATCGVAFFGALAFKFVFGSRAIVESALASMATLANGTYMLEYGNDTIKCAQDQIMTCWNQLPIENYNFTDDQLGQVTGANLMATVANAAQGLAIGYDTSQQALSVFALAMMACTNKHFRNFLKLHNMRPSTFLGVFGIATLAYPYIKNLVDVLPIAETASELMAVLGIPEIIGPVAGVFITCTLLCVTFSLGAELLQDGCEKIWAALFRAIMCLHCFCPSICKKKEVGAEAGISTDANADLKLLPLNEPQHALQSAE
ncbi:MAG: hypothetical protein PUP46_02240 [Endozoicomonas sp. (ex Botrylloides leachii)]|nr:hypothetical protein [Endozoicomonas sp. (ex Botrylloides leachii)]